jgi:endogenous inhibitor of DNA gyrase (YacG/DUF329 family)
MSETSERPENALGQTTTNSVTRQEGGVRVQGCPECGTPVMVEVGVRTGDFARCPEEDCGAWLTYEVSVTTTAFETREEARAHHE